jgi:hypothetical protein
VLATVSPAILLRSGAGRCDVDPAVDRSVSAVNKPFVDHPLFVRDLADLFQKPRLWVNGYSRKSMFPDFGSCLESESVESASFAGEEPRSLDAFQRDGTR